MKKTFLFLLLLLVLLPATALLRADSIAEEMQLADAEDQVDAGLNLGYPLIETLKKRASGTRSAKLRSRIYYCLGRSAKIASDQAKGGKKENYRKQALTWLRKARSGKLSPGRSSVVLADLMEVERGKDRKKIARAYLNGGGRNPKLQQRARAILANGSSRKFAPSALHGIKFWSNPDYTRIVLYLTRSVSPLYSTLSANLKKGLPPRLYLDLSDTRLDPSLQANQTVNDGLLKRVRVAYNSKSTVRVVLDFESFSRYEVMPSSDEPRIVIDVYGTRKARKPRGKMVVSGRKTTGQIIVVDAGHGGKDPGALGPHKRREKDAVLRLALALGKELKTAGYKVVYTRKKDRFLELFERTGLANKVQADLFISIHANSTRSKKPYGFATYYLAEPSDKSARVVAARENNVKVTDLSEIDMIKHALMFSVNRNESHVFAEETHKYVAKYIKKYSPFKDMGVKSAPFYVMYGAQMPSILVEAGFISHKSESAKIMRRDFARDFAKGVRQGVDAYFRGLRSRKL